MSILVFFPEASKQSIDGWKFPASVVALSDEWELKQAIVGEAEALEKNGQVELAQSVALIGHCLGLSLNLAEPDLPFSPIDVRAPPLALIQPNHLEVLEYALSIDSNLAIKARLADLLWLKKRPREIKHADLAIETYMAKAQYLLENAPQDLWTEDVERGVQLWTGTNRRPKLKQLVLDTVDNCIRLGTNEPDNFVRVRFVELQTKYGLIEDLSVFIGECEKWAEQAVSQQRHFAKARCYLDCAADAAREAKDQERHKSLLGKSVDLYAVEARQMKLSGARPLLLQFLFRKAIEANLQANKILGDRMPIVKALHEEMNEFQGEVLEDLKPISAPLDLGRPIESLLSNLESNNTLNGLMQLGNLAHPHGRGELIDIAERTSRGFIHTRFARVTLDEKGRVVDETSGSSGTTEQEAEAVRIALAYEFLANHVVIQSVLIEQGRRFLFEKYDLHSNLIDFIIKYNPFVPVSRADFFRRGLMAGFKGDWMTAVHILVPQIENSIRHVCEQCGFLVTSIDEEAIQQEQLLHVILYQDFCKQVLGEDRVFQLRGLLVESVGVNFRNKLAHGLLTSGTIFNVGPFLWALVLDLCFTYKAGFMQQIQSSREATTSSEQPKAEKPSKEEKL